MNIYMHYWLSSYCNWCCFTTLQLTEILGHCIPCYRNKRSTEHCRMMKQHKGACADVCTDCDWKGTTLQIIVSNCNMMMIMLSVRSWLLWKTGPASLVLFEFIKCSPEMLCFKPREIKRHKLQMATWSPTVMITGKNGFDCLYFKHSVSILYDEMEIFEIKVPLLSAHLPVHNPLSVTNLKWSLSLRWNKGLLSWHNNVLIIKKLWKCF